MSLPDLIRTQLGDAVVVAKAEATVRVNVAVLEKLLAVYDAAVQIDRNLGVVTGQEDDGQVWRLGSKLIVPLAKAVRS